MRSSKRKRLYNILALCIVIGLLTGAYLFLKDRYAEETPEETQTPAVVITGFNSSDIAGLKLSGSNGNITFVKKEKVWEATEPYQVKLLQTKVDEYASTIASLEAMDIAAEQADDLEPFGLKEPTVKSEAELSDDTVVTVSVGKKTARGDSYYLMKDGDPRIYTVDKASAEILIRQLSDFRDRALPRINYEQDLMLFSMSGDNMREIEIRRKAERDEDLAEFGMGLLEITKPYHSPMGVDMVEFGPILEAIPGLAIEDFIDDSPEDISQYGLDKPSGRIIMEDKENRLELLLGDLKKDEDNKRYFKVAGSDAVYTMFDTRLDFMDKKPFDLVEKFALIVNIKDVDKIVVEGRGASHTLTMERQVPETQNPDVEEEELVTYRVDDRIVQEDPFKRFYQTLVGLSTDSEVYSEPKDAPDAAVTFHLNKGDIREIRIEYVPYDRDFYSIVRDGKSDFLIARRRVNDMLDELDRLLGNE